MKQIIKIKDITDLTGEQVASLKQRIEVKVGDKVTQDGDIYVITKVTNICGGVNDHSYYGVQAGMTGVPVKLENFIPLPSIGQLIELLQVHYPVVMEQWKNHWKVCPRNKLKPVYKDIQLINALWEAVKEVI